MPLEIIIAGAGVAGLCAAIGLARTGHKVTVCERQDANERKEETLGGIQMQPNAVRILRDWGALEIVDKIAHESVWSDVRRHNTGETLLLLDLKTRGGTRFGPRKTFKQALEEFAVRHGARISRGRQIVAVREDGLRPIAVFGDNSSEAADLIIGADGTSSKVRRSLFPSFQPDVLDQCVFQMSVPLAWMQESAETRALLKNSPGVVLHMAPGTATFSSPSFQLGLFDLQLLDMDYPLSADPDPDFLTGRMYDMSYVRRRLADHEPGVIKVVEKAESVWKWRLREVRGLPTWSSETGRVLLIGDASHGIVPHAGQGSAMGVEDGAVLAELLTGVSPDDDIKTLAKQFEAIRRPRCEIIRKFATIQGERWAIKDPKKIDERDRKIARYQVQQPTTKPDQSASISSPAFQMWVDQYDVKGEVRRAKVATAKASQARL